MGSEYRPNSQAMLRQYGTTYPKVTNLSSKVRGKINSAIKKAAYEAIPDYDPGTTVIQAQSSYLTTANKNNVLSLKFEDYFYPEMAAHGVTGVSSITINLQNGHVYKFNELFRPNVNYQSQINAIIQAQIIERQIPMLKPFEGVDDDEEFYLTPDSLIIYYQPYVYTPGYFGVLEFTIPYQQITDIIAPSGPIGMLLV